MAPRVSKRPTTCAASVFASALLSAGCLNVDTPSTSASLDNDYPPSSALVVYQAHWQSLTFSTPVAPGASSGPQAGEPASTNTAYAVLAPGWDPASASLPTTFIVLQSKRDFDLHIGDTLHIPVSDATFAGNCAAGSTLTQAQADFITQLVFPGTFAGLHYDAPTCTTSSAPDAGGGP